MRPVQTVAIGALRGQKLVLGLALQVRCPLYDAAHEVGPDQRLVAQNTCIGTFESKFGPPELRLGLGQRDFGQCESNLGVTQSLLLEMLLRTSLRVSTSRPLAASWAARTISCAVSTAAAVATTRSARSLSTPSSLDASRRSVANTTPSRGVIGECDGTRVPFPQQFQSPLRDSLSRSRLHEPECGQPAIVPGICIDIVLEHSVPAPTCAIEYALFPTDLELFLGSSRARITRCCSQLQQRLNRIADGVGRQLRYRRFGLVHQVEIRRQVVSYRAQNRCRYFLILRREISDLGVRRVEKSRHSRLDLFTRSFEVGPPVGCQRCGLRNCRSVAFLDLLRAAVEGSENAENQNKETCSRHNLHSIELRRDQKSDLIVIQHDRVR